jgi:threonylcarbamoyladenosine tRNA methylthiotransferase MtaB
MITALMSDPASAPTAAILTLGCKLNIADSENMARRLREAGWRVTDRLEAGAAAVIVNSCSVTHVADQKTRRLVRQAQREAPDATVALTGCMLETASQESLDALSADVVMRQPQQIELAERIIELRPEQRGPVKADVGLLRITGDEVSTLIPRPSLKTRAFISAQEGCNDVCAFCIIPRTRGRERSKPVRAVVAEAQAREAEGVQEIVITGTQLGAYGRDLTPVETPYALLSALLGGTSAPRVRMSSLQPQDLTDELIGLWEDPRLCRHFHLALQSGAEGVLKRMRRRYTKPQYRDAVLRLRRAQPDVAITTDVIVGFPGETDEEFEECLVFCAEMAFAGIHVFPYSQREHTLASHMQGAVSDAVKKLRVHRLIDLSEAMAEDYRRRFIRRTLPVLWETQRDGVWEGLTGTYIKVTAASDADLRNQVTPVRMLETLDGRLRGQVTQ